MITDLFALIMERALITLYYTKIIPALNHIIVHIAQNEI